MILASCSFANIVAIASLSSSSISLAFKKACTSSTEASLTRDLIDSKNSFAASSASLFSCSILISIAFLFSLKVFNILLSSTFLVIIDTNCDCYTKHYYFYEYCTNNTNNKLIYVHVSSFCKISYVQPLNILYHIEHGCT